MKKRTIFMQFALAATLLFSTAAFAAERASVKDIPIGGSGQMEMVGTIEPTLLSVTMPAFVNFDISNSLATQNKVISPRITMKNNSNMPVQIDVAYTSVDISKLENTTWSDNGTVGPNQIAIGLKQEAADGVMPKDFAQARWLKDNQKQDMNVMVLDVNEEGALYVVGALGAQVTENVTFNVTPTFVVSRTSE